jgi:ribonucleotide monophosphatase NagD (HAD superfamily)
MVIGKPNPLLLKRILVLFGCDAARTTMVGDRYALPFRLVLLEH